RSRSFESADLALDATQPATTILDSPADHFISEWLTGCDMESQETRIEVGAERVDVVDEQMFETGPLGEQIAEHTVAKEIGNFVPVADRVQALQWFVVGVVAPFSRCLGP